MVFIQTCMKANLESKVLEKDSILWGLFCTQIVNSLPEIT